jgi:predicted transglutaminase-like cysteine proteinase
MGMRTYLVALATLVATALGMTAPATAATHLGTIPTSMAMALEGNFLDCGKPISPAVGAPQPAHKQERMLAMLGGRVSKLELIKLQQSGKTSREPAFQKESGPASRSDGLGPSGEPHLASTPCSSLPVNRRAHPSTDRNQYGPDEFLASKRLPVSRTKFDGSWNRVRQAALPRHAVAALPLSSGRPVDKALLATVNSWVNTHIRYVEDSNLYGVADYWATASTTLRRGAGDCEDLAIAKMQMLAALGLPRSNMYLTIARDLSRNADHAILLVKLEGKHWLLDNATNQLLDASESNDYLPIFSFKNRQKRLHGI